MHHTACLSPLRHSERLKSMGCWTPYHHEGPAVGKMRLCAHLVSLLLGRDPPMVDHLGWQEVELDVRVGDPRLAPDEPPCFQMGCGSIP